MVDQLIEPVWLARSIDERVEQDTGKEPVGPAAKEDRKKIIEVKEVIGLEQADVVGVLIQRGLIIMIRWHRAGHGDSQD